MLDALKKDLQKLASDDKARILQGFFKTGKGEYGEGDVFLGISVPNQREIAKKYQDLTLFDIKKLLIGKIHEHRLVALLILVDKYQRADDFGKKEIFDFYLRNTRYVNNWDLVDLLAPKIVGDFLLDKNTSILSKLARSKSIWERRIAIVGTYAFIYKNRFDVTLEIAAILIDDKHDLIQKAVGWMLREVGKRDIKVEEDFLRKHFKHMPRVALRYAIERFDEKKRAFYMGR